MRAALLMLATIGSQLMMPIAMAPAATAAEAKRVPDLNMQKLCKRRSADDRIMREPQSQSVAECVREENAAKQDLTSMWADVAGSIRDRCESEAIALDTRSYLDLRACLQIADDIRASQKAANQNRMRK